MKQAEQKQDHRYRGCFDGRQMGGGSRKWAQKEGIKKNKLVVTE